DDLLILGHLLLCGQPVAGCEQLLHFRILCDQAWIRSLSIDKTNQLLNPQSFIGITPIHKNLRFWPICWHIVSTLRAFPVVYAFQLRELRSALLLDVFLIERGMVLLVTKSWSPAGFHL